MKKLLIIIGCAIFVLANTGTCRAVESEGYIVWAKDGWISTAAMENVLTQDWLDGVGKQWWQGGVPKHLVTTVGNKIILLQGDRLSIIPIENIANDSHGSWVDNTDVLRNVNVWEGNAVTHLAGLTMMVPDLVKPELSVPADVVAEQVALAGTVVDIGQATATDNADPDPVITNDAPAVFPLGDTMVTWTATDDAGNQTQASMVVTVVDTTPPVISWTDKGLVLTGEGTAELWPPNHRMVDLVASDICDAAPLMAAVVGAADELTKGAGGWKHNPDVVNGASVSIRAERSGRDKDGRVYTVTATDISGNSSTLEITVLHSQGQK